MIGHIRLTKLLTIRAVHTSNVVGEKYFLDCVIDFLDLYFLLEHVVRQYRVFFSFIHPMVFANEMQLGAVGRKGRPRVAYGSVFWSLSNLIHTTEPPCGLACAGLAPGQKRCCSPNYIFSKVLVPPLITLRLWKLKPAKACQSFSFPVVYKNLLMLNEVFCA